MGDKSALDAATKTAVATSGETENVDEMRSARRKRPVKLTYEVTQERHAHWKKKWLTCARTQKVLMNLWCVSCLWKAVAHPK